MKKSRIQKLDGKHIFARGKVSSKGWVVIPKEIRDEMGLKSGDEVQFALWPPPPFMKQGRDFMSLHVARIPENPASAFKGLLPRRTGESLWTEDLLRERRKDLEREERKIRRPGPKRKTA